MSEKLESKCEKIFCEKCSLRFVNKLVYDIHTSIVHGNTKPTIALIAHPGTKNNSLKCGKCFSTFVLKNHLKRHISEVHEGKKHLI